MGWLARVAFPVLLFFAVPAALGCAPYIAGLRTLDRPSGNEHPDLFSIEEWESLAPGTEVFLSRAAFVFLRQRYRPTTWPVAMRVVERRELPAGRGLYRNWTEAVFLHNAELGTIAFPLYAVVFGAYRRADFATRAPYEPGEAVQLGSTSLNFGPLKMPALPGDGRGPLTVETNMLPYLARFVRAYDERELVVRVIYEPKPEEPGLDRTVRVAREQVSPLAGGTAAVFEARLRAATAVPAFSITQGDTVRFRGDDGRMREGIAWRRRGTAWEVRSDRGAAFLPPARIFRGLGLSPVRTPDFANAQVRRWFTSQSRWLSVLDAAARLTSTDDFVALPSPARFALLIDFVQSFLRYSMAASGAQSAGFPTVDDVLSTGIGVCRYSAVLLDTILNEAGYPAQAASWFSPATQAGHAWVDVGQYILCPSGGGVATIEEAFRNARREPHSSWAHFLGQGFRDGTFAEVNPP